MLTILVIQYFNWKLSTSFEGCTVPDIIKCHTIIVLPLTTVYFVSEVHVRCTSNVLHSITP